MDRFNFLMVLLSIIIGLGTTEILVNIARQVKARKTCKAFWVHSGVVALLFLGFLQIWWESWGLHEVEQWAFPHLLLMIATPVGLFIISHLVFPDDFEDADMEQHYFDNARLLWGAGAFTILASILFKPLAFGHELWIAGNASSFGMVGFCIALAATGYRPLHLATIPIFVIAMALDVMLFQPFL